MIEVRTIARLGGEWREPIRLRYDPGDPYAVQLVIGCAEIEWTFARQLLDDGLNEPTGLGDVRVWTRGGVVYIALESDVGSMQLELPRCAVGLFLRRAFAVVPLGSERIDTQGAIDHILRGVGS